MRLATALVYLALIALAELVTTFAEPRVGLTLHGGLLVILLLHTALASGHPYHRLLLGLSLAPLTRILSLSLPLVGFPLLYWYLVISVPLFVATVLTVRALGFSREQLGLTMRKIPVQFLVVLTGFTFGIAEYYILRPDPLIVSRTWQNVLVSGLILLVCTGFAEELIFRGVIQRASVQALGRFGLLYVALLFAVLHIGYKSVLDVVFVFIVALLFGWVAEATWSLVGISVAHGLTNIVLFLIMPFWGR
jgi:membrane protease YdiL (CAAX protease family)